MDVPTMEMEYLAAINYQCTDDSTIVPDHYALFPRIVPCIAVQVVEKVTRYIYKNKAGINSCLILFVLYLTPVILQELLLFHDLHHRLFLCSCNNYEVNTLLHIIYISPFQVVVSFLHHNSHPVDYLSVY